MIKFGNSEKLVVLTIGDGEHERGGGKLAVVEGGELLSTAATDFNGFVRKKFFFPKL